MTSDNISFKHRQQPLFVLILVAFMGLFFLASIVFIAIVADLKILGNLAELIIITLIELLLISEFWRILVFTEYTSDGYIYQRLARKLPLLRMHA